MPRVVAGPRGSPSVMGKVEEREPKSLEVRKFEGMLNHSATKPVRICATFLGNYGIIKVTF
jgi:hypothetical protein